MIPYGRQKIDEKDIRAVVDCLNSDMITQGPLVQKFESKVATITNSKFATSVSSATAALHLACLALEIGVGDHVWVSSISFVATANCVRFCGAEVDFLDIDPFTVNVDVGKLAEKLANAKVLPKAVIVVHMGGSSCLMREIKAICDQYGVKVIEDASHAIGAYYNNKPVGCCEYSDICVFSFHPVKIVTTGEGGAITTNSAKIDQTCKLLRSHGIMKNVSAEKPWFYDQVSLGLNYRLTDIQCALGLSQLNKLSEFVSQRNKLMATYKQMLDGMPLTLQSIPKLNLSSYHLCIIRISESVKDGRDRLYEHLKLKRIGTNIHYKPIYKNTYYRQIANFPNLEGAEAYYNTCISLPLYPDLSTEQIETICDEVKASLRC